MVSQIYKLHTSLMQVLMYILSPYWVHSFHQIFKGVCIKIKWSEPLINSYTEKSIKI